MPVSAWADYDLGTIIKEFTMPDAYQMPVVWQLNATDLYLAPSLEQAIQESMKLSDSERDDVFDHNYGLMVTEDELEALPGFYGDDGEPRSGLDVYQEMLADGKTVQPFVIVEDGIDVKRTR